MNKLLNYFIICLISFLIHYQSLYSQTITDSIVILEPYFKKVMTDWQVPHLAIGVVKDSKVVYVKGFGFRDYDKGLIVNENTLFKIASITKPFTAMTFGILADQNKFDLDTPIVNMLPSFKMHDDYITKNVTVRDLLTNRTGLPRHGFLWYGTDNTRKEIVEVLPNLEPAASFREKHIYTNLMYDVVAYIIEEVSNQSWEEFTKTNLLGPLNMDSTNFGKEIFSSDNFAYPYNFNHKTGGFEKHNLEDLMYSPTNIPAGGINTSIKDMCNWMIFNLNKGRFNDVQVASEKYVKEAHSIQQGEQLIDYSRKTYQYGHGLGWYVQNFHGNTLITFGGMTAGFNSRIMLFPNKSIGIVVFIGSGAAPNYIISESLAEKLILGENFDWNDFGLKNPRWTRVLEEIPEPIKENKIVLTRQQKAKYIGSYNHPAYGEINIHLSNENLLKFKRSKVDFELATEEKNTFRIFAPKTMYMGREVKFIVDEYDQIIELTVNFENQLAPIHFYKKN